MVGRIGISKPALMARLNRHLAKQDQMLRAVRGGGERARLRLGEFVLVDTKKEVPIEGHISLEEFARKVGVLKGYEVLDHFDAKHLPKPEDARPITKKRK